MSAQQIVTDNLDLWTSAITHKSSGGRGSNGKLELTGINKLRELILELAVRGKLVPQDPNDEPASELLKRIEAEKVRLVKEGKIKKPKELPEILEDEEAFELPSGWLWARLEYVSEYIQRGKGPKYADERSVKVVSQKCVQWSGFDISPSRYVSDASLSGYQDERFIQLRDILWNSTGTGTVGRAALVTELPDFRIVADSHVTIIRPLSLNERFVYHYLLSSGIQHRIDPNHETSLVSGTTKQVELNTSSVKSLPIPLAPLAEQHRIVEKVDDLMALCDHLEQQTSDQISAHEALVDALLDTLVQAKDAAELADNWARLAAHFDTLLTNEQSIERLKQTILQLAVMGRLVPQDPNDEPASELLKRIEKEKAELIKAGTYQKASKLKKYEVPHPLPKGWKFVQIGNICPSIVPNRDKPKSFSGHIPWITLPSFPKSGWYLDVSEAELRLSEEEVVAYSARMIPAYSVLMSCVGRFGLTAINDEPVVSNQQIHAFIPLQGVSPEYISFVIRAASESLEQSATSTTIKYLNKTNCESISFGLPPTAEQYRIVEKVSDLIAICDRLKALLNQANETRCHLAEAVVEQAVAS